MRHLNDGTLRRILDEPLIVTDGQRAHLRSCERCTRRSEEIAADAQSTSTLFTAGPPTFQAAAALQRVHRTVAQEGQSSGRLAGWLELYRGRVRASFAGVAATLALVSALLF